MCSRDFHVYFGKVMYLKQHTQEATGAEPTLTQTMLMMALVTVRVVMVVMIMQRSGQTIIVT
jgi:hypothetical protein